MPQLSFWYEFASTYSYLSALRIEQVANAAGVEILWRPFLLGPIFEAQGWTTSPFNIYPAKGRYMVRDIERIAESRGHKFVMPATFPANGLRPARLATLAAGEGWAAPFTRAVYTAQFEGGADISDRHVLANILSGLSRDAEADFAASGAPAIKDQLRCNTQEAQAIGIFGAPSFVTADGELFWGDDRLGQAVAWATRSQAFRASLP